MSIELVNILIKKGAKLYASVSGGKDGEAMVYSLLTNGCPANSLIHADLGRTEWKESMGQCVRLSNDLSIPLVIVKRTDGLDMLAYWERRMIKLEGTGKPFWSSSKNRYCTSDLKRDPINNYFRKTKHDLIISCEGIRAEESTARASKEPFTIRTRITSEHYAIKKPYFKKIKKGKHKGKKIKALKFVRWMSVEEAIAAYKPGKRLALTWYPIFNFTIDDVWATKGQSRITLQRARNTYQLTNEVPYWWNFHPAYVYGNDRVSCMLCILGSTNDLKIGAAHNPELLQQMIELENKGNATFKNNWSLKELL